jgi:hypothetical protein
MIGVRTAAQRLAVLCTRSYLYMGRNPARTSGFSRGPLDGPRAHLRCPTLVPVAAEVSARGSRTQPGLVGPRQLEGGFVGLFDGLALLGCLEGSLAMLVGFAALDPPIYCAQRWLIQHSRVGSGLSLLRWKWSRIRPVAARSFNKERATSRRDGVACGRYAACAPRWVSSQSRRVALERRIPHGR